MKDKTVSITVRIPQSELDLAKAFLASTALRCGSGVCSSIDDISSGKVLKGALSYYLDCRKAEIILWVKEVRSQLQKDSCEGLKSRLFVSLQFLESNAVFDLRYIFSLLNDSFLFDEYLEFAHEMV